MEIDNMTYNDKNAQFIDLVEKITLDTVFDYKLPKTLYNQLKDAGVNVNLWYKLFGELNIYTIGQLRDAIINKIISFNFDSKINTNTLKIYYDNKEIILKSIGHDVADGIESILKNSKINGFNIPNHDNACESSMISLDNFESNYKSSPNTFETLQGMSCLLFEKNGIVMPIIKEKIKKELTQKLKGLVNYPCGTDESLARQKELDDLISKYKKLLNSKRLQRGQKLFIQDQKIGGYYEYTNKINRMLKRFHHNEFSSIDALNTNETKSRNKEQSIDDFSNLTF